MASPLYSTAFAARSYHAWSIILPGLLRTVLTNRLGARSGGLGLSRFYPGGGAFRGSYETALREMIPPQFAHTVTFTGMEPYEKVIERCAGASLLVNPSLSESFGMSLVETLATGTPVVATPVGGMTDIVEATGGGVLVEKNDPAELSYAIVRRLADPESSNEVGRRGAARVADLYAWEKIASRPGTCMTRQSSPTVHGLENENLLSLSAGP
jgi:glycosyltransferase involved in cell wall biosynthesis